MHSEKANAGAAAAAGIGHNSGLAEAANASGFYTVQCHDQEGNLLWEERIDNLVTTVGGNFALDTLLSGSGYTAAWYIGLIGATGYTTGPNLADTAASHGGWAESTAYSNAARGATSWNAASAKSKALSAGVSFTINATDSIKGMFLISNSAKGGTTGTLYSAGLFTGGDQPVVSGNVLTVSYTATI